MTNGTSYTFTVFATNAVGNSPNSAASNAVTPVTVPGAPTSVAATAGDRRAFVTFSAPASNGGSPITGYTVTSSPAGGVDTAAGSLLLTRSITGLTAGTPYTFTVVATNAIGTSVPSAASNSVTPTSGPTPIIVTTVGGNAPIGDGLPATSAHLADPYSYAEDSAGNRYIADGTGNRVRKIAAGTGIITTFAGTGVGGFNGDGGVATSTMLNSPAALAIDASDNVYIADNGNHRVRKVTPGGVIITYAGNGSAGSAGDGGAATSAELNGPRGLSFDGAGNLYISDSVNHKIRMVSPGGVISTVAGTGTNGFNGDGAATSSQLNGPAGITFSGGSLYIADASNDRVRKLTGSTLTTVAGNGTEAYAGDGGPATSASLWQPLDVAVDGGGNLYIADSLNATVRMVAPGGNISTFAGVFNTGSGFSGDGGPANAAQINFATCVDSIGATLYICDSASHRIRAVTSGTISTIAGGDALLGDGGNATNANLYSIAKLARDASGNLYLSDRGAHRIRKVAPNGVITTVAGIGESGFSGDSGPATSARLNFPSGIAVDASNNIYIADRFNQRVRKISAGGVISTLAGTGAFGYNGDGIAANTAQLRNPISVAVDSAGNVYIAEISGHRVRKVSVGGTITTVAGTGTFGYNGDGITATSAQLSGPIDVAVDAAGNLYITEGSGRVRKVDTGGTISTFAGNGTTGASAGDGGLATGATFNTTHSLAVHPDGRVFISDSNNCRVRVVDQAGAIETYAGSSCGFGGDGGPATSAQLGSAFGLVVDGNDLHVADLGNNRVRTVIPTTAAVPDAPQSPVASAGNTSATVSFGAPASDGGSPILGYTVLSNPAGGVDSNAGTTSLNHNITGLTNGVSYTFTVVATNAIGTGPASAPSNAVTPATLPGAPTIGTATAGNGQATITFTAPANDGGSAITGYTATSSPGGITGTCVSSPCVVSGLSNGTSYNFTVFATNAVGNGPASAASNSVTPLGVPGAPTIGTATAGNGQASITFTAPASNGGSAITGYTATSSPGGLTGTCASSPCVVTGLTNGTSYTFTVFATNAVGNGPASAASNAATPATVPGVPTIGTATAGNAQASITFTAPASNGGSAITGYTVTSSPGGITGTCASSPCVVTGLSNGTSYTFTVFATNAVGNGPSSAASNAVTPASVPGAPTIGTATAGNGQASITFTAPASNGGSAITGYTATSSPGGLTGSCGSSPCVVSGLTNGTSYTFTVFATNALGNGPASAASNAVTPATVPSAPTIGTATAGNGQASITFTAPANNGGSAITGYTATSSPGGFTGTCVSSPCTVAGLSNGTAYTFTVFATNAVGNSAPSAASNSVTPVAPTQPYAWVVNTFGNSVSVIDTGTGNLLSTIGVGSFPTNLALNPAGTRVYVTNSGSNSVTVLDTASFATVATIPVGSNAFDVAVTPDGTRAYVNNAGAGTVSVINTANNTVLTTINVAAFQLTGITINPAGTRAYVTSEGIDAVIVIDTASNAVLTTIPAGTNPRGIAISPDGTRLYVPNQDSANVTVMDAINNTVVTTLAVGNTPFAVAVNPAGTQAWVANYGSNSISRISTASNTVLGTVAVGTNPEGIAFRPDGAFAYVTNNGDDNVKVIETGTNTVFNIISVGDGPQGVEVAPTIVTSQPGLNITGNGAFGNVTVTATSTVRAFTLRNPSLVPLTISSIANSNSTAFQDSTTPASQQWCGFGSDGNGAPLSGAPVVLPPGATCTLNLVFKPVLAGASLSATITITSDAATSPQAIGVSGTGVAPAVAYTPGGGLNFGSVGVGTAATTQTGTFTNNSPITLSITSASITGGSAGFSVVPGGQCLVIGTLGAGQSCTFSVGVTPTAVGAFVDNVQINTVPANAGGSLQVTVTGVPVVTVPGAPTIGTATSGNGQATITFTAPANDGGSAITGYTATSSPGGLTGTCASSPCVVSGLTNGTSYTFTVFATNAAGNGPASAASNAVTPATVPSAPTIGTATAGNGQASITFTAPANNGGSAITGYTATSSPGGITGTCTSSPCVVTGLINGTSYTFTVFATNAVGNSAASAASNAVTPATVPGAPTIGTATAGNGQASISFTAGGNGGSAITGFTATSSPGGITGTCASSPCLVTGLTNGTSYTFTVFATNANGNGPASSPSNSVTPAAGVPAYAYVPNTQSANVSVIDTASNTVIATVPVGVGPYGVAVNPTAPRVYVGNQNSNSVSVIDSGSNSVVATIPVGAVPQGIAVNPAGTFAYVANRNSNTLSVINTATNTVVATVATGTSPQGVDVSPDGTRVYVANAGSSSVSVFNAADNTLLTSVAVGSNPVGLTVNPAGTRLYVVRGIGNSLSVVDTVANAVIATVPVGLNPLSVAVNPAGTRAYVSNQGGGSVSVIDTATNTLSFTFGLGGSSVFTGLMVNPAGNRLYVFDAQNARTLVYDTCSIATVVATITVGNGPSGYGRFIGGTAPAAIAPCSPTGVSAVAGNAQATVSFSAPASNGGSAITSYTATSNPGGLTGSCSSSPCVVTGLANGTSYTFTVVATNAIGSSPPSSPSSAVTPSAPITVPGVPVITGVVAGNGQATISFTAPANGGSPITGYTATSSPGGITGTCASSPCVVTGLTNGTSYTFTLFATNAVGNGGSSSPSSAVTPATVPGVPTITSVVAGNGQATLSFTTPGNGGSPITSFTATSSPGGISATCTSSPCVVTGLSNGTSYTFTLYATNAIGNGVATPPSGAVTPATVPGVPTITSVVAGNGQVTVNFTAPASTGGSAIIGYTATSSPTGITGTCASSPCVVTGLANGTSYTFTLFASNAIGSGASSSPSGAVTPATVPGAPTSVTAVAGNAQATVSFTAPASNGGSAITGYTATSSPGGISANCASSPCVVAGLTNGTSYTFTVFATNAVGNSPASSPSVAVTPATVPNAPTAISAVAGNAQATVSFTAPVVDGGSAITGYVATSSPGGITGSCAVSPCVVTGLTNGTSYTFSVRAINALGSSFPSIASNAVTPTAVQAPQPPTNVVAVAGNANATVSFSAPANDGGSPVTGYTVTSSPTGGVDAGAGGLSTSRSITGLANGTLYTFTVVATNAFGSSAPSAPSNGVIPSAIPSVSLGDASVAEGNSGTSTLNFVVSLSQATGAPVNFTATTSNGTATAGSDYVARTAALSIPAGQTSVVFAVTVNGDTVSEGNETVNVALSGLVGAKITDSQGVGTILDDDGAPPSLSIADVTVAEGNSGTTTANFVAQLSRVSGTPVTLTLSTSDGTATAGSDYVARTATLVIPAGQSSASFAVAINGDTEAEPSETFTVTASAVSGATVVDGVATGTIGNDDQVVPALSIADASVTEGNSGTTSLVFAATLSQPAQAPVSFTLSTSDGTATAGSDYAAASQAFTIPAGQSSASFTVAVNGDTTTEANETVVVTASAVVGATVADGVATGTILDDDAPLPALSIADVAVVEGNFGLSAMNFTVSLSAPAGAAGVAFDIGTVDTRSVIATAQVGTDYQTVRQPGKVIPAGQSSASFTVKIMGDTRIERDEALRVRVENAVGATVADGEALGRILNDDGSRLFAIQGEGPVSPVLGQQVTTQGIVTARVADGFFLQAADAEREPGTTASQAIFVAHAGPAPAIGDRVEVGGRVRETLRTTGAAFSRTEIAADEVIVQLREQPLPAAIVLDRAKLHPAIAIDALERFEAMRVGVPAMSVVAASGGTTDVASGVVRGDGIFHGVAEGVARPFREAGLPLLEAAANDAPADLRRFDGNPERLRVDSASQIGATALAVDAGDRLTGLVGVLDDGAGAYTLLPDANARIAVESRATPRAASEARPGEASIAWLGLRGLYDDRDDPGREEPVAAPGAYALRLAKAANAICGYARAPAIVAVGEVENLATLSDLAAAVNDGCAGHRYRAWLAEGDAADGLDIGYLVDTRDVRPGQPRVQVLSAVQQGRAATRTLADGRSERLHQRVPLLLRARLHEADGKRRDLSLLASQLQAVGEGDGADARRDQRRAQARNLAEWVQARQQSQPRENLVLLGEFAASEFGDGHDDVLGLLEGRAVDRKDAINAGISPVTRPLRNLTATLPAAERYTRTDGGDALATAHVLASQPLADGATLRVEVARLNADFGEDHAADAAMPMRVSESDPVILYVGPKE